MVTWLLGDPLGRTFLVLPIFTIAMFVFGAARFWMRRQPDPVIAPSLHAIVVVGVLAAWFIGRPGAGSVVSDRLGVGPVVATAVIVVPAAIGVYLLELWVSERLVRVGRHTADHSRIRPLEQLQLVSAGLAGGGLADRSIAMTTPMRATEAFDVVVEISRRPKQFLALSVVTATAEELLYRVAMLDGLVETRGAVVAVLIQATAYAANHLPFGVAAFIGKLVLGTLLGATVVATGSVVVALIGHGFFQFFVYRRIRRLDS